MSFSAVVLAAGTSSRMRGAHKMLLPWGGQTVIRHTVQQVLASGPEELVVVTGFKGDEVAKELQDQGVVLQPNPRFDEGQMTSVAAGCAALTRPCDAVMVCLGDMVLLTPADYAALAAAHAATELRIVVPRHAGQRGNPVIFAADFLPEVIAGRRNMGCRKLIADHPGEVFVLDAAHPRYSIDIDTPEDYARLCASALAAARPPPQPSPRGGGGY